jgi:hypothetical protein
MSLSFLSSGPCPEELRPFNAHAVRKERARNWSSASVMLRAMPACRAGDVTGCLADENGSPGRLRPCNIRVNSAAFYWLNYRGMKMVEVEGLAPPLRLGVGQLP